MGDIISKRRDKSDFKISVALMASFVILTFQYFILIYFDILGSNVGSSVQALSKGLVGITFLYAFPTVYKKGIVKLISVYSIAVFIFLIHYIVFPENRVYITRLIFPFFFISLPSFIYTLSLDNMTIFKDVMKKSSYIVFLVGVVISALVFTGESSVGAYSMSLSYYMLLPMIIFLDDLMDDFSFKTLLLSVLSLIIILSLGSRGAILCIVAFILLKFLRPGKKKTSKMVLGQLSILGIGILFFIFLEDILMSLYEVLLKFGINSRSLILFLGDDVHLSGRDRIYEIVSEEILSNPIFGIGLAGDTRIIGESYVHNFFIEIIGNFGLILGIPFIIIFIILVLKSLCSKDIYNYNMTAIWLSLGFIHLMVSSSYLIDIKFWILMGLIINFSIKRLHNKLPYKFIFRK